MTEVAPETKGIIWDLDGTLIDSFEIFLEINQELASFNGLTVPDREYILDHYHGSLPASIAAVFEGQIKESELEGIVEQFLVAQVGHYDDVESHLLTDALDLAQRATQKGLLQAIVTNRDHAGRGNASPRNIVASTPLNEHIHDIICGDEGNGFRKPETAVLGDLLDRWKLQPQELLVIGDQYVDAQLALNLGAKAIIVSRGGADMAHAHKLDEGWEEHVTIVASLEEVNL